MAAYYGHGQHAPPPPNHHAQMGQQMGQMMGGGMQMQMNMAGMQINMAAPSPHYGNQGAVQQNIFSMNAFQAVGFNSEQELEYHFNRYFNPRINGIQAEELVKIMNETQGIKRAFFGITFGPELCKIMMAMMDRTKDGIMQWKEFRELLQCLTFWQQTFITYDTNRSGYMESHELGRCIYEKFGYKLNQQTITTILKRYSRAQDDGRVLISFEDFVALAVRLRAYTEAFRSRDRATHNNQETGSAAYGYDDFLQCTLCL